MAISRRGCESGAPRADRSRISRRVRPPTAKVLVVRGTAVLRYRYPVCIKWVGILTRTAVDYTYNMYEVFSFVCCRGRCFPFFSLGVARSSGRLRGFPRGVQAACRCLVGTGRLRLEATEGQGGAARDHLALEGDYSKGDHEACKQKSQLSCSFEYCYCCTTGTSYLFIFSGRWKTKGSVYSVCTTFPCTVNAIYQSFSKKRKKESLTACPLVRNQSRYIAHGRR